MTDKQKPPVLGDTPRPELPERLKRWLEAAGAPLGWSAGQFWGEWEQPELTDAACDEMARAAGYDPDVIP